MPSSSSSPAAVARSSESNPLNLWGSLRTELLWTYEGQIHPANRRTDSDHRQGYWVWLIEHGSVTVTAGKTILRARQGQWLVSPHAVINQDFSADARILSLHFSCQWPTGANLFAGDQGAVFDAAAYPRLEAAARRLLSLVRRRFPATDVHFAHQPAHYDEFLLLQLLFTKWLRAFAETMEEDGREFVHIGDVDERLMKAVRVLNETPLEAAFPASLLHREAGVGRAHLDRLFFQAFGSTTRGYWDQRRLEAARILVATTPMPIKEAAFRLGFKQVSHFTKWFLRLAGRTPLAFRSNGATPRRRIKSELAGSRPPPPPVMGGRLPA